MATFRQTCDFGLLTEKWLLGEKSVARIVGHVAQRFGLTEAERARLREIRGSTWTYDSGNIGSQEFILGTLVWAVGMEIPDWSCLRDREGHGNAADARYALEAYGEILLPMERKLLEAFAS